ncbi:MAG: aminoacyl-tRNA hydrolase [Oscillospiraceae bacterium]|nr:aminoacyl-tRNA hydrolase [Oscillospiraceae bacterium]
MLDDLFAKLFSKKTAAPAGPVEFIIAGLGNPGADYEYTRHNAGFLALDHIAEKIDVKINRVKFKSYTGEGVLAGKKVLLIKPATYMNKSGEAIVEALGFYKLPVQNLLVLVDDIALPTGALRIRGAGSDGGQNGLKNIIYLTGEDAFPRVRIGVGSKPHQDADLRNWVLTRFSEEEGKILEPIFEQVTGAAEMIVSGDIEGAMNRYNKRGVGPKPAAQPNPSKDS